MSDAKFSILDFRSLCSGGIRCPAEWTLIGSHHEQCAALRAYSLANAKLEEIVDQKASSRLAEAKKQWLEELLAGAPKIYGFFDSKNPKMSGIKWDGDTFMHTHTARLVDIRPIGEEK